MGGVQHIFVLACTIFVSQVDGLKTYGDMFPHKHAMSVKFPPIPGWNPDGNPWDDYLYPPFGPKELTRKRGKPVKVRLTSDSPAINGSCISFTAKLEYPKCQKEDANGFLVWDEHCDDANGQVRSGFVYNWTSWLDDYGFGKCTDLKKCNVFPDGKPFAQSNDWRHKGYVYVWHTMGQYYETCDGSSSSLTLNTTNITMGAGLMEVMVYRKRERRKYSPLSTDNTVFYVSDKIPLAVNISQKAAANLTESVFVRGEDVVFTVQVHDPSDYLKTAAAVDYIWDFKDGNQLVTHSNVATHAYVAPGNASVKLTVEAAFRVECPPATPTSMSLTSVQTTVAVTPPPGTHALTSRMETTAVPPSTARPLPTSPPVPVATGFPTTEPLPPTEADVTPGFDPTVMAALRHTRLTETQCFRYLHGTFQADLTITEPSHVAQKQPANRIVDVSAAKVTNTDISFLVRCQGSAPTSACTIVSDPTCRQVRAVLCEDVPPGEGCEVRLRRTFREPGTYCVNITLADPTGLALATTSVTVGNHDPPASSPPHAAEVVLSASTVLVAIFAFIAFMAYKRYKVYRPIRRSLVEDACGTSGVGGRMGRLRDTLFPASEESRRLLIDRRPL